MLPQTFRNACALAALVWLLVPLPAWAQDEPVLDSLLIELWPEFDRPSVLVILSGTLPPDIPLPRELTFHIPAASGGPHAVAVQDDSGNLLNAPYTTTSAGGEIAVTFQADWPNFQLEYYDPQLTVEGETREYVFEWTGPAPVRQATLRVQEPFGAIGFTSNLPLAPAGSGEFGLNYRSVSLGQLSAGQAVNLRLQYSKTIEALSLESVRAGDSALPARPEPVVSRAPFNAWWVVAGGAGVLAIGAGVYRFARNLGTPKRQSVRPAASRGRARRKKGSEPRSPSGRPRPAQPAGALDRPAGYCPECGQPHGAGERFCRNCGGRLRV